MVNSWCLVLINYSESLLNYEILFNPFVKSTLVNQVNNSRHCLMVVYFSQMEKNTGIIAAPETWIGYSICNLLCCCCPLGVVSVIFSVMTESANNGGDYSKASKYSKLAAWFNIAGISLGSFVFFGSIIFVLVKNGMPWKWSSEQAACSLRKFW